MRNKQSGVSLFGLLAVSVVLVAVALVGMKLVPSYLEFMAVKKVIKAVLEALILKADAKRWEAA